MPEIAKNHIRNKYMINQLYISCSYLYFEISEIKSETGKGVKL